MVNNPPKAKASFVRGPALTVQQLPSQTESRNVSGQVKNVSPSKQREDITFNSRPDASRDLGSSPPIVEQIGEGINLMITTNSQNMETEAIESISPEPQPIGARTTKHGQVHGKKEAMKVTEAIKKSISLKPSNKEPAKKNSVAVTGKRQSIEDYAKGGDLIIMKPHNRMRDSYQKRNADIEASLKADLFSNQGAVQSSMKNEFSPAPAELTKQRTRKISSAKRRRKSNNASTKTDELMKGIEKSPNNLLDPRNAFEKQLSGTRSMSAVNLLAENVDAQSDMALNLRLPEK